MNTYSFYFLLFWFRHYFKTFNRNKSKPKTFVSKLKRAWHLATTRGTHINPNDDAAPKPTLYSWRSSLVVCIVSRRGGNSCGKKANLSLAVRNQKNFSCPRVIFKIKILSQYVLFTVLCKMIQRWVGRWCSRRLWFVLSCDTVACWVSIVEKICNYSNYHANCKM